MAGDSLKRLNHILILISLIGISFSAQSETEFYAGIDAQYGIIHIKGENYHPVLGRINGGFWLAQGIGIEAMLGTALSDDASATVSIDVPTVSALSIRMQSPEDWGTKAYALLGYSRYELEGHLGSSDFPGTETFAGPGISIGFMRRIAYVDNISGYLEFTGYFANEEIDFGALTLGLRYGY